ncbi:hypothetical protein BX666DRAFT_2030248 [Dichotomocladium elegans]|nr:hypothetical protein BX666DRAFT_2030248 [Dichotomocladium elegans]
MTKQTESLIRLSAGSWTIDQKRAVARIAAQVLRSIESIVGETWSCQWWFDILGYLGLTQAKSHPMELPSALLAMTCKDQDIRIDVILDLLAVAMHLTQPAKDTSMVYDSRARRFFFELGHVMGLDALEVCMVERSIAQQMYFALQESRDKNDPHREDRAALMDQSAQNAIKESNKEKRTMRWLATGAGVLGGGALIALTGGLAAPLLAPLLVGLTGAAFFATAGGIALVTSLFGLTGGGLAGWKMHRRVNGVDEFNFEQILDDADLPPIPSLQCTICISGYLLDEKDEFRTPWELGFSHDKNLNDIYCLQYESDALLDLGIAFQKFVRNQAIRYAGLEVAKQTALNAFFAALALPATLLKIADIIDNPWEIAADRSRKAGIVLADVLEQRVQGNRPCSLVGYSCGCLVIWECLQELYKRNKAGLIHNIVLMGAPIPTDDPQPWLNAASMVSGRFINCHTDKDWVLAFVYRLHSLETEVAGLKPMTKISRIENVELDLDGHTAYREAVKDILDKINLR